MILAGLQVVFRRKWRSVAAAAVPPDGCCARRRVGRQRFARLDTERSRQLVDPSLYLLLDGHPE